LCKAKFVRGSRRGMLRYFWQSREPVASGLVAAISSMVLSRNGKVSQNPLP